MQKRPQSNSGLVVICSKEPVETKKKLYLQFEIKIYVNFILDVNYLEKPYIIKQLLDEVFVISSIIKVEVSVISQSQRLRTLTKTLLSVLYHILIYCICTIHRK
jgi:hypothetical protein